MSDRESESATECFQVRQTHCFRLKGRRCCANSGCLLFGRQPELGMLTSGDPIALAYRAGL